MPRYIDSDVLLAKCKAIISDHIIDKWNEKAAPASWAHAYLDFIDDIENVPTADVEPVRHGRWEDYYVGDRQEEGVICTVCKELCKCEFDYCPNCGAKMDGGERE